ncbi:GxxExxY protein [Granulicella arctica]|uniref:GxxExxY protein n=1 Tax=Granulicella arctica TaxID=940613 RepID=UPI0021E0A44E|nr:GxxExxY protein [Granulicella arctica]
MNADKELQAGPARSAEPKPGQDEVLMAVARPAFSGLHSIVTDRVLAVYFDVYNELGGGFLESVYQQALRIALVQAGLRVAAGVSVPVYFRGESVGIFRADLIVNACVLLELKAVATLDKEHEGQIVHYLRATDHEVGLLLNFGPRPQFKRFILENTKKKIRVSPRISAVALLGSRT